jgi:esterase/lipase
MRNLGHGIYLIWFWVNQLLVDIVKRHISPMLSITLGMLLLEGHTLCKAAWYTWKKYRGDPKEYGLDQWQTVDRECRPVLLLHGAVGSWAYLGDLAVALRRANIPVFVINHGFGLPTDETRRRVFENIQAIRNTYKGQNETASPLVDIVAHSNGGNLALDCAFTTECSSIDSTGALKFRDVPQANADIGRIITIALPSNAEEVHQMQQIGKEKDLFNINAKYDALMSHKKCALVGALASHAAEISAAHVGIVFQPTTYEQVIEYLRE